MVDRLPAWRNCAPLNYGPCHIGLSFSHRDRYRDPVAWLERSRIDGWLLSTYIQPYGFYFSTYIRACSYVQCAGACQRNEIKNRQLAVHCAARVIQRTDPKDFIIFQTSVGFRNFGWAKCICRKNILRKNRKRVKRSNDKKMRCTMHAFCIQKGPPAVPV